MRIPTAPGRFPVVGHAPGFLREPVRFMESLAPVGPMVRMYFGSRPFLYVSDPELVYEVLQVRNEEFEKGALFEKMKPLAGEGVGLTSGDDHRMQRRMLRPALQPGQLGRYAEVMHDIAHRQVDSWTPGRTLRVDRVMVDYTIRVIVGTLLPAQEHPEVADRVRETVPEVLYGLIRYLVLPELLFRLPLPANRRARAAVERLKGAIDGLVASYCADPPAPSDRFDLLSHLIDYRIPETGERVSRTLMRDEVMSLMIAGHETTSSALTSVFWLLDQHPELRERLHGEVDALGEGPVRQETLERAPFTRSFVREVLRLYNPTWLLPRRALRDVRLGDVVVPAGTELVIAPMALHRRPDVFPRPHVFAPDRWSDGSTKHLPKGSYIPFGLGPHVCMGAQFAEVEILTFLLAACRRWKLVRNPPVPARFRYGLIARIPELHCTVTPR
ncbi:cytochrome P450 [Streptomyces sp. 3MP-14]|uniref:Cytochrome P450 n=1 Tax=Streptomyces mimosae TaxID=2586635 RepID=A0A5N6ADS4_9ACTN|nr:MULTISPECIES: cytochrome P450 [Streptomyces]KAB8166385.1 cytochrome P450 [Streptomyces mimosae]KAB8174178.1 cytochrome P450 [Streptomyces sp. 3MP-14]